MENNQMAKIKGTKEAFTEMLNERGVYKKLGVERSTVANWKTYLRKGEKLSLDKMEEMLKKYGAKVISQEVWDI